MKLQNIAPITELKRDAAALIERAADERTPIVITQNGRATAVLVDVESYEEERRAYALLKLVLQGEQEVRQGHGLSLHEHRKRVRRRLDQRSSK
jgi:prevent-host-death family protein